MRVNRVALVVIGLATAVGCTTEADPTSARTTSPSPTVVSSPAAQPSAAAKDAQFVARLVKVERSPGWRMAMLDGGAGLSRQNMLVGPATFHLADGRRLRVDAKTRGGNMCWEFIKTAQDRRHVTLEPNVTDAHLRRLARFDDQCVIVGQLRAPNHVAWYSIIKVWPDHHAQVGLIRATDERTVTTADGLTWPVAKTREFSCGQWSASIAEAVANWHPMAVMDVRTRHVVRVTCAFPL